MLTPITDSRPKVMWTEAMRTYYVCSVGSPFKPGGLKYVAIKKNDKVIY